MELTRREIHAAVRNYMANDLGLNRTEIESILREQIERRNPEELTRQAVARYFRCGPNYFQATDLAKKAIDNAIHEQVANALKNGAAEQIKQLTENFLASALASKTETNPETTIRTNNIRPDNVCVPFEHAIYVRRKDIAQTVRKMLNDWFPDDRIMTVTSNGHSIRIHHVSDTAKPDLAEHLKQYGTLAAYDDHVYELFDDTIRSVISRHMCDFTIYHMVSTEQGYICLGKCDAFTENGETRA